MNMQSETIGKLAEALAAAQAELQPATKNSQNPFLKNKYADLASVFAAIRSVFPSHGLAVVQTLEPAEKGYVAVRTSLMHKSGEWISGILQMPCQSDKGGIGPQQMGSALTYCRRYSLASICGVVSEDDDDGEAAQASYRRTTKQIRQQACDNNPDPMTPQQSKALMAHLTQKFGDDRNAYLKELSDFFERQVKSSRELTRNDVASYLDAIAGAQNEQG